MPEHDPHDQTDPAGESFDPSDDEAAIPTDQGADSADSSDASPAADSSRDEAGYVDQSFAKIDKLADALSKLSQASTDDDFNAKIRRITQQASDAQIESADQPAPSQPIEQIEEPTESQVDPSPQPQIDDIPPVAPDVPVESIEPSAPIEASEPSDEQIATPPLSDLETSEPPFDPAAVVQPLEAFVRPKVDDIQTNSADEGSDGAEPQQPETEDTGLTSEHVSDEVTTTPPESQSLDPIAAEQELADLGDHSHTDESDSAGLDDVQAEALGSAPESSVDQESVDAPLESVDDVQIESSDEIPISENAEIAEQSTQVTDPPVETFEPTAQEPAELSAGPHDIAQDAIAPSDEQPDSSERPNEQSETPGDTEPTSIGADQPDGLVASERDSESEAPLEAAGEAQDHEPLADSSSDAANAEPLTASFTAEELEPQIDNIIRSFDEIAQAAPPRPVPQAIAHNRADESALLDSQPDIDLSWLANELNDLLNPEAAEPASGQQSESGELDDPVIEGAASPEVDTPQLPDQESAPPDGSSRIDDAPHEVVTVSGDVCADFDEIAAEQAEPVSELDAPQHTEPQAESAPAEPIGAEMSIADESIASVPIETVDLAEDDPVRSEVSPVVQDSQPSVPTQETPADETPDQAAADLMESVVDESLEVEAEATATPADETPDQATADLMKSVTDELSELEVEVTASLAEESSEDTAADSMPTEPPTAANATGPDESAGSTDDAFSALSAQLDELLGDKDESSPDQTPSDPVDEARPAINTAAPSEEAQPTGDSLEDAPEIEAQVSPESDAVDEPDDLVTSLIDESDAGVDDAPVAKVQQPADEGTESTDASTESAAVDESDDFMASPVDEAESAVDEAPTTEVAQPVGESVDSMEVSPEPVAVDEAEDSMAMPADEDNSSVDEAPLAEVAQQPEERDESTEGTADTSEGDVADDAEAQAFMSDTESDDAASGESIDQTAAETDAPSEDPETDSEAFWPDSGSADESDTDFMMNDSDSPEEDAQPETEAVDGGSEQDPEAAANPDKQSQDDADAGATEELKEAAVATVRLVRFHKALERIEPVAVPVLRRVNYPLRHVPQALRPIVDWIALSLLFWVPIVWVIALLAR